MFAVPRTKPKYPDEFRREAIELMRVSEKRLSVLSKDLGVSEQTLRNWRHKGQIDAGEREGLSSEERAELQALRKRVRTLEMEREVLKKAAVFFARESETR